MIGLRHAVSLSVLLLALGACASQPFDLTDVDHKLTPSQAVQNIGAVTQRKAQWGGTILDARNLKDRTQIEVLTYPLDRNGQPNVNDTPLGRVLLVRDGYVETADYAAGREVTAVGPVLELRSGQVGEATYTYPVLQATQLKLWPKRSAASNEPRFHFGFGVGVIR